MHCYKDIRTEKLRKQIQRKTVKAKLQNKGVTHQISFQI
jgi:hypothetical protein